MIEFIVCVDGSDSITAKDYPKVQKAIAGLIDKLDIRKNNARMGIVVYSTNIALKFDLTDDKKALRKQALNMPHPREGTETQLGIKTMRKMFKNKKYHRPGVPTVGIVLTDGISRNPEKTRKEAEKIKALGVDMFAVGVTDLIDENELNGIASNPKQVLKVTSFDELVASIEKLIHIVCPSKLFKFSSLLLENIQFIDYKLI